MADESSSTPIVWFAAGVAVGATIALLFAPASGKETRKQIVKKTQEGTSAVAETGRDMLERGRDMIDQGRKLADEAAEMFEKGRKLVENTAASLKG